MVRLAEHPPPLTLQELCYLPEALQVHQRLAHDRGSEAGASGDDFEVITWRPSFHFLANPAELY